MSVSWSGWTTVGPQPATAAWPGLDWVSAVDKLTTPDTHMVQICPQSRQNLNPAVVDELKERWPDHRWRLHANIKLWDLRPVFYDASTVQKHFDDCFVPLAQLSNRLGADLYSLHVGRLTHASPEQLIDNVARLEDLFGHAVAVEGMYPCRKNNFHVADSDGYRWLLDTGLPMAIDVSHLHIVRRFEDDFDDGLLDALLQS